MENSDYIQIIAKGEFIDALNTPNGIKKYRVAAYVIRLSPEALDKYFDVFYYDDPDSFETRKEYEENRSIKKAEQKPFIKRICDLIGISDKGIHLTQNVSEVFTVTQITEA